MSVLLLFPLPPAFLLPTLLFFVGRFSRFVGFAGHAVGFVEPTAEIDRATALAAKGHGLALLGIKRAAADRAQERGHQVAYFASPAVDDELDFSPPFESPFPLGFAWLFSAASAAFLYESLR
jgi:hypothetical protein